MTPASRSPTQMDPHVDDDTIFDPEFSPSEYEILVRLDEFVDCSSPDEAFTVIKDYLDGEPRRTCLEQYLERWDRISSDESFLNRFFGESVAVVNCSPTSFETLLFCEKNNILEDDDSPLRKAIRDSKFHEKAKIMIDFMHQNDIKFDDDNDANPPRTEGRQCLTAAFDKSAKSKRALDKNYIIKLVKLGPAEMLNIPDEAGMLLLHRLVEFDNCYRDPEGQLELVKFLLDRCEESILKPVPSGAKYTIYPGGTAKHTKTTKSMHVYQWHLQTKREYGSGIVATGTNQRQLRSRANRSHLSQSATGSQKGKDAVNGTGKGLDSAGRLQDTKGRGIKPVGGVDHSKKPSAGAPDISLSIRGKLGKSESGSVSVRPLTPPGEDARDQAKKKAEEGQRLALQASAKVLDELGRRYLKLTVGKDQDETDARKFFEGNDVGTQSESRCDSTYCPFQSC